MAIFSPSWTTEHWPPSAIFTPSDCTYQVDVSYTGNGGPNDSAIGDTAIAAQIPVPTNLDLSGSVTIDAYVAGPITLPQIEAGYYTLGPLSSWGAAMGGVTGAG